MMYTIKITPGELVDKQTILLVKKDRGLEVDLIEQEFGGEFVKNIKELLYAVNNQLFDLENAAREKIAANVFDYNYIEICKSITILNDKRHEYKQLIDQHLGYKSEVKKYAR
jgi:hypothetical protein